MKEARPKKSIYCMGHPNYSIVSDWNHISGWGLGEGIGGRRPYGGQEVTWGWWICSLSKLWGWLLWLYTYIKLYFIYSLLYVNDKFS